MLYGYFSIRFVNSSLVYLSSVFSIYSSNGRDWMYEKKPISIFGLGVNSYIENNKLKFNFNYLQLGLLGNVNQDLFDFSPQQSYPYIDDSKDAEGHWTEHLEAKLIYNDNNLDVELVFVVSFKLPAVIPEAVPENTSEVFVALCKNVNPPSCPPRSV